MKSKRPNSIFRSIYEQPYHEANRIRLYNSAKGSLDIVQRLGLLRKLPIHNGCVNCICWSDNGELLLSGSDDQHLVVSHAYTYKTLTDYKTSHRANVFSAKFLPCSGDKNIVSCSGDGIILFTDLVRPLDTHNCQFNCHTGTTYEVATIPGDPHTFLSCGEDYTVRCFDLRIKESCNKADCQDDVLISCKRAVTALTVNNLAPHQLAIGCSDSTVRLFDRRMLGTKGSGFTRCNSIRPVMAVAAPGLEGKSYRITSLAFSPEGEDILVSYSSEHLYLFSTLNENSCQVLKQENYSDDINFDTWVDSDQQKLPTAIPLIRRLRLRGDWSDTGPDARPEREPGRSGDVAQARPTLHATLMQRMTDVLSRMLNDPATRAALSHGGEDEPESFNDSDHEHENNLSASGQLDSEHQDVDMEQEHELEHMQDHNDQEQFVELDQGPEILTPDPIGCTTDSQNVPDTPSATNSSENVSLPSFESTYSSYSIVKSPLVDQQSPSTSSSQASSSIVQDASEPSSIQNLSEPSSSQTVVNTVINSSATSNASDQSLRSLTDQLSNMRDGFIEKHGTEPMVNLHYSDKGSTASRITMSVADEVNREHVSNHVSASTTSPSSTTSSSVGSPNIASATTSAASTSQADKDDGHDSNHKRKCLSNISSPSQGCTSYYSLPSPSFNNITDIDRMSDDDMESNNAVVMNAINTSMRMDYSSIPEQEGCSYKDDPQKESLSSSSTSQYDDNRVKVGQTPVKQKYTGHRNARTMIKEATFWGTDYVLSGSDCGHVFVWDRKTARLVMLLEADHHVVNCIQPHPQLPILATSGIDYDVKLWAPIHEEPVFDTEMAEELMKRNEVMLEETKDTITVPASFMIRMLACLNQIRRRRLRTRPGSREGTSNSSE